MWVQVPPLLPILKYERASRKEAGKDTNLDFLTQECVKEAKKIGELLNQDRQSKEE